MFLKTHVGRIAAIALAMLLLAGCEAPDPVPVPIEEPVVEQPAEPVVPDPTLPVDPAPGPVIPPPVVVVTPVPAVCKPSFDIQVNGTSVAGALRDGDKVVVSYDACRAESEREQNAKQRLAFGGAAPGQGAATITGQLRKTGGLPRDVSRFGTNAVDLSGLQKEPSALVLGRSVYKIERQTLDAFEFHQRPWLSQTGSVSFTVRVDPEASDAQYGANLTLRYACSDRVLYDSCDFGQRIVVVIE